VGALYGKRQLPHDSSYFVFDLNIMAPNFYTLNFFVMKGALTKIKQVQNVYKNKLQVSRRP
jgi:hypothetical protein